MRLGTLLLAGLLCSSLALAADIFKNYTYTAPPGWTTGTRGGSLLLTPPNLPTGATVYVLLVPDEPVSGDFAAWYAAQIAKVNAGLRVTRQAPAQSRKADDGSPVLESASAVTLQSGETEWRYYVGANVKGRGAFVVYAASSIELIGRYQAAFNGFTSSLDFTGSSAGVTGQGAASSSSGATTRGSSSGTTSGGGSASATGGSSAGATSGGSGATAAALPALKAPTYAEILKAGLDPKIDPLPDEFRCYLEQDSDKYDKPALVLQILPKNQYRLGGVQGTGTFTVDRKDSSDRIRWTSGGLARSEPAFLAFRRRYGQEIWLYDVGETEGKSGYDLRCYQRGAREDLARLELRRKDPQPGQYPCVSTTGSNKGAGTLEILPGRRYRLGSGGGSYTADITGDLGDDFSHVDFKGGPLDGEGGTYREDDAGLRRFGSVAKLECKAVVKPTLPPQFGAARAPAPPTGSGGLEGFYFTWTVDPGGYRNCGGLCYDFYRFSKNGYVFTEEPDSGLEEADCTKTYPSGFPVCEVYRLQGSSLVIGGGKPLALKRNGARVLGIGGQDTDVVVPVDNLKLEGRYYSLSVTNAAVGVGGVSSSTDLALRQDGRFTRASDTGGFFAGTTDGTALGDVTGGVAFSNQRSNSGTYRFYGNTLELKYADGRVVREFAFLPQAKGGKRDQSFLRAGGRSYNLKKPGEQ